MVEGTLGFQNVINASLVSGTPESTGRDGATKERRRTQKKT